MLAKILPSFFLIGLVLNPTAIQAEPLQAVWSGRQDKEFTLFISTWEKDAWGKGNRILAGPGDSITPAMTTDRQGRIWIVWITRDKEGLSLLRYQVRQGGALLFSGSIDSGFQYNYAPTLLIDHQDRAWAAWSSLDGEDEDIFASRFDGKAWSPPMRVNSDDPRPDILPILAMDDNGAVVVTWESLENDGYERFQARWEGEGFGRELVVQNIPWIKRHTQHLDKAAIKLPAEALQHSMATIACRAATGIQSVPQSILLILQRSMQDEKKP